MNPLIPAAVLLCALVACAHTPLATEASTAAIRGAEEAGAANVPTAALHLQYAKEEEAAAVLLQEQGRKEEAESLLLRSAADAELAVVLARAEAAQLAATEAQARADAMKTQGR